MSQSPAQAEDQSELGNYVAGWNALNSMLSHGGSFSGRERNCVFLNCGPAPGSARPRFANISALSGFDYPDDSRAIALVDWDQDGDLDLWASNRTAPRLRYLSNSLADAKRSLALSLEGVSCNRDAIGARVVLQTGERTLTRTLSAGHGYLSQSSKWLHFGLGADSAVESVTVHWPGGKAESFSGIAAGGRFLLVQGRGKAKPWKRPAQSTVHRPAPNEALPSSALAQVRLPRRIPTPKLAYRSGTKQVEIAPGNGPLLVVLFASWCPHCQAELRSLSANATKFNAANLEVLALSMEALDESGASSPEKTAALLAEIRWPYRSGTATADLLARLEHLNDALFELRTPFAVPYSLLLDSARDLVSLYRGPIPSETLFFDLKTIADDLAATRDHAIPFPGKWYTMHPDETALLELLADHFQPHYSDDAVKFLERAVPQLAGGGNQLVIDRLGRLHFQLGSEALAQQRFPVAESHFRSSLRFREDSARAHHDLGVVLFNLKKYTESERSFLRCLELAPGNPSATTNLQSVRRALQGAK